MAARARTRCRFDELRYDVAHNRILKATLNTLLRLDELDPVVRRRVARVERRMGDVANVTIRRGDFRTVQLNRNNRFYAFLLRICLLIHDQALVEEGTGRTRFRDIRDDELRLWRVFEDFVYKFYRRELPGYRAARQVAVAWHDVQASPADLARLPEMRADTVLESRERCVVVETKFYGEALVSRFGAERLNSAHLYQLHAYVTNRAALAGDLPRHEGLLLYPAVRTSFAFDYRIGGRTFRVRTVDLGREWREVHGEMVGAVG